MDTTGQHLLIEYTGCDRATLDDPVRLEALMRRAARAFGATVVESMFHAFEGQGVTGVLILEESHFSIHTWPERGYAAVDLYTCRAGDPRCSHRHLRQGLKARRSELLLVRRGESPADLGDKTLHTADHCVDTERTDHATESPTDRGVRSRALRAGQVGRRS